MGNGEWGLGLRIEDWGLEIGGGGFGPNILSLLVLIEIRIRIKTRL